MSKKISALAALTAANATDAARVPVVSNHTGTDTSYRMSIAELRTQLLEAGLAITGGTAANTSLRSATAADIAGLTITVPTVQDWSLGVRVTGKFVINDGNAFAGTDLVTIDAGTDTVTLRKVNTGTTDHGAVANGANATPFLNATPEAGIWLVTARSYGAGTLLEGAALYVSGGTAGTTHIFSLATSIGASWQLSAVDLLSPIIANATGGSANVVTAYLRLQ